MNIGLIEGITGGTILRSTTMIIVSVDAGAAISGAVASLVPWELTVKNISDKITFVTAIVQTDHGHKITVVDRLPPQSGGIIQIPGIATTHPGRITIAAAGGSLQVVAANRIKLFADHGSVFLGHKDFEVTNARLNSNHEWQMYGYEPVVATQLPFSFYEASKLQITIVSDGCIAQIGSKIYALGGGGYNFQIANFWQLKLKPATERAKLNGTLKIRAEVPSKPAPPIKTVWEI